jgi:hypothetical protein
LDISLPIKNTEAVKVMEQSGGREKTTEILGENLYEILEAFGREFLGVEFWY